MFLDPRLPPGHPQDVSTPQHLKLPVVRSPSRYSNHQDSVLAWRQLHLSRAKLKASSRTSALLSGFAMIAMVELQMNNNEANQVPTALLITFTACTTLLVSVHMLALMISTCILPNVDAVASMASAGNYSVAVYESPHRKMRIYIEIAWAFSTVFGIFLFLIELAILCWVKFWDVGTPETRSGQKSALVATIMLIPIGVIFIGFAVHFYRTLVSHKFERSEKNLMELESLVSQLPEHGTRPEVPSIAVDFHDGPLTPNNSTNTLNMH